MRMDKRHLLGKTDEQVGGWDDGAIAPTFPDVQEIKVPSYTR